MRTERTQSKLLHLLSQVEEGDSAFAKHFNYDYAFDALKLEMHGQHELQIPSFYMHVKRGLNWGLCDRNGNEILPCIYEDMDFVYGCMAYFIVLYKINGNWGAHWLYPKLKDLSPIYDCLWWDQLKFPDKICCQLDGKEGLIDYKQRVVIPMEYDTLTLIENKKKPLLKAQKGNKWGIIDCMNNVIVPFEYDAIIKENHKLYGNLANEVKELSLPDEV